MTFPISPGVYDREIDASVVTIQAAGSPAAFVANLDWGPVLKRKVISSEEQLKQIYSRPFLQNNYDFLLASQFLSYSDNLLLTRVSSGNNSIGGRSLVPVGLTDCEGATQSFKLISLEGIYNAYIDDVSVATEVNIGELLETLMLTQQILPDFMDFGLFTSYRAETTRLRLERTDAAEIAFDPLVNPTARVTGNVLNVCLLGGTWAGGIIEQNEVAMVAPAVDGFITLSSNPSICSDSGAAELTYLLPQAPINVVYKYAPLSDNATAHIIANFSGAGDLRLQNVGGADVFAFVNRGDGEAANLSNLVTFPLPSEAMDVTFSFDFDTMLATIDYVGYTNSFAIKPTIVPARVGDWGVLVGVETVGEPNSCSAIPLEIKFL